MNEDEIMIADLRNELDTVFAQDLLEEEAQRLRVAQAIRDNPNAVMTVGKQYRGHRLDTIPHDYLAYVLNHFDLTPELRRAILAVLGCEEW